MTPAISPSLFAASIMPRFTYIGPPGKAKALISLTLTTLKLYLELRVLEVGRNGSRQAFADAGDVGRDAVVVENGQLLLHLRRRLAAELYVLLRIVLVVGRGDRSLRRRDPRRQDHCRHAERHSSHPQLLRCRPRRTSMRNPCRAELIHP